MAEPPPLDRLRRALPELPPRLRDVGQFVARHDFDATTRSMRELAASCGANPATFTRLAQALGYTGWDALRDALIEARRPAAPFSGRTALEGGAAAMLAADASGLARLAPAPIEAAARAVHAAPRVWVAGFRSCAGVAALLHYQLRLFRPDEVRLVGAAPDLDHGAFRAGDAVLVFGFAPYSRAGVQTARAARRAGCALVALADLPDAPVAEGAAHLLLFDATGPGFFPSLTGAVAVAQALAAAVFALGGEAARVRLRETEARLASLSQYVPEEGGR